MANEAINATPPQMTAEQKAVLKKVLTRAPDAQLFESKSDGKYYGPVLYADKKNVVQQVGQNTYVVHPRQQLGELPTDPGDGSVTRQLQKLSGTVVSVNYAGKGGAVEVADSDRWHERQNRIPASPEHSAIAKEALGDRFDAYYPPAADRGYSTKYEGVVVGVTDDSLIQRINSRTAIVHTVGPEVAKQFGAGQEAVVRYDNGRLKEAQIIERPKGQEKERPTRERAADRSRGSDDQARAASWVLAKNLTAKIHGDDIKLYSAERLGKDAGKFRGPIVAMTDHHVIQRVGTSNTFVAHVRENVQGELQTGRFTQINYDQGKAQAHRIERSQDRPQGQAQERGTSSALRTPDRGRPSQGMSR